MRSDEVGFWQPRYAAGETPWDFGGVPIALKQWLQRESAPGRVLIPGCGAGHEVRAFDAAGWDVTAIDYTPPPSLEQRPRLAASPTRFHSWISFQTISGMTST